MARTSDGHMPEPNETERRFRLRVLGLEPLWQTATGSGTASARHTLSSRLEPMGDNGK